MTLSGWIFLLLSWGFIVLLNIFCFAKVFGKKDDEEEGVDSGKPAVRDQ